MAKRSTKPRAPTFNFGANVKPRKATASKGKRKGGSSSAGKANAWASYTGGGGSSNFTLD